MPPEPPQTLVRLVAAIALLLLLLVGGLAYVGYQAMQAARLAQERIERQADTLLADMHAMRQSIHAMQQELAGLRTDMGELERGMRRMATNLEETQAAATRASEELAKRQQTLDRRLVARSRQTLEHLGAIERRRREVAGPPRFGAFSKLDQMIGLQQVMADAILLMNEHLAETQAISARELRPLPIQH